MASAGSGMLFDSAVNVLTNISTQTYTVPSGKVFSGQIGAIPGTTTTILLNGSAFFLINVPGGSPAEYGNSAVSVVLGPGTVISTASGPGYGFSVSGVLYVNP